MGSCRVCGEAGHDLCPACEESDEWFELPGGVVVIRDPSVPASGYMAEYQRPGCPLSRVTRDFRQPLPQGTLAVFLPACRFDLIRQGGRSATLHLVS
ncbi:MAG TPA: hypothetical protein VEI97_08305 [bacterium]|nr:hypothetical protein [bacterium]